VHLQSRSADIRVICRSTGGVPDVAIREAVALLSAAERSRFDRFTRDIDRRGYALAHALLRNTLASFIGCEPRALTFEADSYGKPRLSGIADVSFSLSHTNGLVACGVARGRDLGIDAEAIDRRIDVRGIASRHFTDRESGYVTEGTGDTQMERFLELWTLKEAFLKATGRGMSQSLDSISFDLDERESIGYSLAPDSAGRRWQFAVFRPTDRHLLAVGAPRIGAAASISVVLDDRPTVEVVAERTTSGG
jgi:4'-phosphopantetheinyl transferase